MVHKRSNRVDIATSDVQNTLQVNGVVGSLLEPTRRASSFTESSFRHSSPLWRPSSNATPLPPLSRREVNTALAATPGSDEAAMVKRPSRSRFQANRRTKSLSSPKTYVPSVSNAASHSHIDNDDVVEISANSRLTLPNVLNTALRSTLTVTPRIFKRRVSGESLVSNASERSQRRGELLMTGGAQFLSRTEIIQMLPDRCITVYATTWNLGGRSPLSDSSLDAWVHASTRPDADKIDMYIMCMQEVSTFDICVHHGIVRRLDRLLGARYAPLIWVRKWGQMLVVFVTHALMPFTTDAEWEFVPSEVMVRPARTKGAIAAAFRLLHTSFLVVGCHLSYRTKRERIMDYHKISQSLRFDRFTIKHKHSAVSDFDRVLWLGDLNFRAVDARTLDRLLLSTTDASTNADAVILANDQLINEMKLSTIFERFHEAPITFQPTYKYYRNSNERDPRRRPAYTDRILYRANSDIGDDVYPMRCIDYRSLMEQRLSDHRPVVAVLKINVVPSRRH